MRVETIEEVARLVPTVSALLAGFSFSMIRGLMFHQEKRQLTSATMLFFIAACAAMLVVTFNATYILIEIAIFRANSDRSAVSTIEVAASLIPYTKFIFHGGLICLFAGGGLLGWLHSTRLGILSSLIMLAAGGMILRTILLFGMNE